MDSQSRKLLKALYGSDTRGVTLPLRCRRIDRHIADTST